MCQVLDIFMKGGKVFFCKILSHYKCGIFVDGIQNFFLFSGFLTFNFGKSFLIIINKGVDYIFIDSRLFNEGRFFNDCCFLTSSGAIKI